MSSVPQIFPGLSCMAAVSSPNDSRFSVLPSQLPPTLPGAALPALNVAGVALPSGFTQKVVECLGHVVGRLGSLQGEIQLYAARRTAAELTSCALDLRSIAGEVTRLAELERPFNDLKWKIEHQEPLTNIDVRWVQTIHQEYKNDPEVLRGLQELLDRAVALDIGNYRAVEQDYVDAIKWMPNLQKLAIRDCEMTENMVERIAQLTGLRELDLSGSQEITCYVLTKLRPLVHLQSLNLANCNIVDDELEEVRALTNLRELNLTDNYITDAGLLLHLDDLERLYLEGCPITDDGLKMLQVFDKLQVLGLEECFGITGAGFSHLRALPQLQSLYLSDNLTDKNVSELAQLTQLRELVLYSPGITDAGLPHLYALTNLARLKLSHCQVTDEGIRRLQQCLPQIRDLSLDSCPHVKHPDALIYTLGDVP